MIIPDFNMRTFFLISVIGAYLFYLLLRKPIEKIYNIKLPLVPNRYPNNPLKNYLQPIIYIVGLIFISCLQLIILVLFK